MTHTYTYLKPKYFGKKENLKKLEDGLIWVLKKIQVLLMDGLIYIIQKNQKEIKIKLRKLKINQKLYN